MKIKSGKQYIVVNDVASGGVNTRDEPIQLEPNESPYILNMDIDKRGRVITRFGFEEWASISGITGGFRGVLPYYRTYGTDSGDYLLTFHSDGNAYFSTNTTPTPSSISAYGATTTEEVRGIVFDNKAIFSNKSDVPKKWEGTGNLADLGGTPGLGDIWAVHNRFLLLSGRKSAPSTIYNSEIDDAETWSGGVSGNIPISLGDGQNVEYVDSHTDACTVFKEKSKLGLAETFDDSNVMVNFAQKEIVDRSGGCVATGSAQPALNQTYYLSGNGFQSYGAGQNYPDKRMTESLSFKLKSVVGRINYAQYSKITSIYANDIYKCATPLNSSTTNNFMFVYNELYGAWTLYDGINTAGMAIFRDANRIDQEYFVSNSEPKIFKRNKTFSDDGFGYTRIYRSKTWRLGLKTHWRYIDLYGSKVKGKDVKLRVNVDSIYDKELKITDSNLMRSATGSGYIGDNYSGDNYVGGGTGGDGDVPMYKWHYRYDFGSDVNVGRDMFFELRNQEDGAGWSFESYGIAFEPLNENVAYINSY